MEILLGNEAKEIINKTLNTAYDAVAHTLGPKGSNAVIIAEGKTIITNDGVSIIKQLKMDNEIENMPLNIIKEACLNAENKSGDGTTTAVVLTKWIYNRGLQEIREGANPITLRNKILNEFEELEKEIRASKTTISSLKDVKDIATVSLGGNKELGNIIGNAFGMVNYKGLITQSIDPTLEDVRLENIKGYMIPTTSVGLDIIKEKEYKECSILIYEGDISTLADLKNLATFNRNNDCKPTIIFSNFTKEALDGIMLYNNAGTRIMPFSLPKFGKERENYLTEIRFITDTKVMDKEYPFVNFNVDELTEASGKINSCYIKKEYILFNKIVDEKMKEFEEYLSKKNPDKLDELKNGICNIHVGAKTKVEAQELSLRIEDAINSVRLAIKGGIVIGGANLMYKLANKKTGIIASAMENPLLIVCRNANCTRLLKVLDCEEKDIGINAETGKIEDLMKSGIIDPVETVINSLKSAVSIATSLLTINCIVKDNNKNGGF